jgi:CHAD domain-containing protein
MLTYLNSCSYVRFKQDFWARLNAQLPELQPAAPVSRVVQSIVSEQLAALMAQAEIVAQPEAPMRAYHQFRIYVKHLRYTLTFFRDLLGPEAVPALDVLETLQDTFGDLQDAVVAVNHLRAVTRYGTWELPLQIDSLWRSTTAASETEAILDGTNALLRAREAEIHSLAENALDELQTFHEQNVPQLVGEALAGL